MKHLMPLSITDAMLLSSSVPENDYPVWSPIVNYSVGNRVIRPTTHCCYECLTAGVSSAFPENSTSGTSPRWFDLGPTNRWAKFDSMVNTKSIVDTGVITESFAFGAINGLVFLEIDADSIEVEMVRDSTTVYSRKNSLKGYRITTWYEFFFTRREGRDTDLAIIDIPKYSDGIITVTITKSLGPVECGGLVPGNTTDLGKTQKRGFSLGIKDFSIKDTDTFGRTKLLERNFAKKMQGVTKFTHNNAEKIFKYLAKNRAKLGVWLPEDSSGFSHTYVYGFCTDFRIIEEEAPVAGILNFEVEGVI
jgi:hypothetical protein